MVPYPVASVGHMDAEGGFAAIAMLQRWADALPLFLHSNWPKVGLGAVPASLADGERRYTHSSIREAALPPGIARAACQAAAGECLVWHGFLAVAGHDLERSMLAVLQRMRCDPVWVAYMEARIRARDPWLWHSHNGVVSMHSYFDMPLPEEWWLCRAGHKACNAPP